MQHARRRWASGRCDGGCDKVRCGGTEAEARRRWHGGGSMAAMGVVAASTVAAREDSRLGGEHGGGGQRGGWCSGEGLLSGAARRAQ